MGMAGPEHLRQQHARLSVNLSPDGNTLAIGSPGYFEDYDRLGCVRVFSLVSEEDLDTDTWNQIGQDIKGEKLGDMFGCSVSLSDDAKIIMVGAPYYNGENRDNVGRVSVYHMDDSKSNWIQLGNDVKGEVWGDQSGWSVTLLADGKNLAIGSFITVYGLYYGCVRMFVLE
jgi:hypothetical protein